MKHLIQSKKCIKKGKTCLLISYTHNTFPQRFPTRLDELTTQVSVGDIFSLFVGNC